MRQYGQELEEAMFSEDFRAGMPERMCEQDRRRSQCKECLGSSICSHKRQKSTCKESGERRYASIIASGAGERIFRGRASAPTSAGRAFAWNTGDQEYGSITASGAGARSAWDRASTTTSASRARARNFAAVPRTRPAWMQAGVLQLARMPSKGAGRRESKRGWRRLRHFPHH